MALLIGTSKKRDAWIDWLDHCRGGAWSNPTYYGRTIGGVPTPAVDAYAAHEMALKATGYVAVSRWAYNFRGIGGAVCTCANYGRCSLHSNGIAIDIDPRHNPFVSGGLNWSRTKFTPVQIAAVEAIRNTHGEQMWSWGGRWRTRQDYMHFELQVGPDRCTVDWSTVVGYDGTTPPPIDEEEQMLKRGDNNRAVADAQRGLIENHGMDLGNYTPWPSDVDGRPYPPGADGDFGGGTESAVKVFQGGRGLAETGTIDGVTLALITDGGAGAGAQGPPGPKGDQGPQGPAGREPTSAEFGYD